MTADRGLCLPIDHCMQAQARRVGGAPSTMKQLCIASNSTCGSHSSTMPWSLAKRLTMRPVGLVWKNRSGACSTLRVWHIQVRHGQRCCADKHVMVLRELAKGNLLFPLELAVNRVSML